MMRKLGIIELEVIHFDAEDIITSSGGGTANTIINTFNNKFIDGSSYAAMGKELNEGGYSLDKSAWYVFKYEEEAGFTGMTLWNFNSSSKKWYVWYNNKASSWYTDNKQINNYYNGFSQ